MKKRTLMIVDDDPDILDASVEILEAEGYTTVPARNGQEALDLLALLKSPPDLIVLDLMMPVMDGWELVQRLREESIEIPIFLVSADRNVATKAGELGAVGHLAKPFELSDFLRFIRRFLENPRQPMPPPPDMPSAQRRSSPLLEREVYPYVMGGLLHDALNVAWSLQHFSLKDPTTADGASKLASRMQVGLERLVRVLRLMQDISRTYYVPGQEGEEQEAIEKIVHQYRRTHPEVTYSSFSQSKPLNLPAGINTFLVGELLENATRACADLPSPRVELGIGVEHDGTASIVCADTGRGFPEGLLAQIRSGHLPRPDGVTHRGHGLYLMKEIIERLRGSLLCANREEGGARVQILLPLEQERVP